jgi:hypothetical protein
MVATALAWGAVSVVRRNVTERRVAPLSARAVSEALVTSLDEETTTTSGPDSTTTTIGVGSADTTATILNGGTHATVTTRGSSGGRPAPTTRPTAGGTPSGNGGGTTPTSSGGTTGGQTPPGGGTNPGGSSQPTPTTVPEPEFTGERVVDDGNRNQVDVRCQGQTVSYGWITPSSGWSYQVLENGPVNLIVKFKRSNPSSESRLEASCDAAGHPTFTWKH